MASGTDDGAKSQGPVLVNLNVCLIILSSIVMVARLYARGFMTKALGVDDIVAVFGFVSGLRSPILTHVETDKYFRVTLSLCPPSRSFKWEMGPDLR
jgi:hypothetical protein